MADQESNAERWWPHLSIEAKHAILSDPAAPLPEDVRREIAALVGDAPQRLGEADRRFIGTQTEAVD
ncbi:hypothetical protein [Agromyces arachidis]|uniref:hypothetical protein n=1 Tax=Agromyces arachidis TaxID=766966 RepID=UPI004057B438